MVMRITSRISKNGVSKTRHLYIARAVGKVAVSFFVSRHALTPATSACVLMVPHRPFLRAQNFEYFLFYFFAFFLHLISFVLVFL